MDRDGDARTRETLTQPSSPLLTLPIGVDTVTSMTIAELGRPYCCRFGGPTLHEVDTSIFRGRYFSDCMRCGFCHDACCSFGADVDRATFERMSAHASALESFAGVPKERWVEAGFQKDDEYVGGAFTRTRVEDERCVFLNRKGRGCLIHAFCIQAGLDYHELKPMICSLFPLTWDKGRLFCAVEVREKTLPCVDQGPSVYRGVRDELRHYFGDELVTALDLIERPSARP